MKSCIAALAAAALVFGASTVAAKPEIGKPAPDFTLLDANGKTHQLSDYAGKTVVLEWFNPGCPFVKKHYGAENMQKQQAAAGKDGVVWLTVNSSAEGKQGHLDGPAANAIMAEWNGAPSAVLLDHDGTVGHAYGARTTPHMYVIDGDGNLRYNGAIDSIPSADKADLDDATQYVSAALAALADGKPVDPALSQPYGCSVKY
ncbi:MAG: thioredoxin family protein [Lysobacteraceae bacterium]